jgi:hypothetical protein
LSSLVSSLVTLLRCLLAVCFISVLVFIIIVVFRVCCTEHNRHFAIVCGSRKVLSIVCKARVSHIQARP